MEQFILLLVSGFLLLVFVAALSAIWNSRRALTKADRLEAQFRELQAGENRLLARLTVLEGQLRREDGFDIPSGPVDILSAKSGTAPTHHGRTIPPSVAPITALEPASTPAFPCTPLADSGIPLSRESFPEKLRAPSTQAVPIPTGLEAARKPASTPQPSLSLEHFMGVKLFAWVGGLALFLGIVFFVKLSLERGWISPELRTALGFVTGVGLLAAGAKIHTKKAYAVLAHTLMATGVVVLYGMTFAAHAYYKFPVFSSPVVAFAIMTLITATAFLLAAGLRAQVVAVLGMIGGFLTPILCATGRDHPVALFGYLALLDMGVLAVAKQRRWHHLTALAAACTILMQLGWFTKFFEGEGYAEGVKTWGAVAVFIGFAALFTCAAAISAKVRNESVIAPAGAALGLWGSALLAAFVFLGYGTITDRPVPLYTFVLLINLGVIITAWMQPRLGLAPGLTAAATFVHLTVWTQHRLTPAMLPAALVIYLVFGLLHTASGALWQRKRTGPLSAAWTPTGTLLLLLLPVLRLPSVSWLLWPALLVADLGIVAMALLTRRLLPVFAALGLTLLTLLIWLLKQPDSGNGSLTFFLVILGGFGLVFTAAGTLLSRNATRSATTDGETPAAQNTLARWLPIYSAVLPFVLLIFATLRLHVPNPTPVFGMALLFSLFLLGLGRLARITALSMGAFLCVLALETVWHVRSFNPMHPWIPLAWYLGFYAVFSLYPHLFRRPLQESVNPWATAALAGVGTFALVYHVITTTWPNHFMGLLPVAFAVPAITAFLAVRRLHAPENPARLAQMAWFGGVALLFVTLIFPVQFDKQWLTVAWGIEGAALCWLFIHVPHPGLRLVGAGLLSVSFARLALNPGVLDYHVRGAVPVWNWQLYAYGLVALSQFLAAWWLVPPRHLMNGINLRAVFAGLGGTLLFLLLNIEIADAFTPEGCRAIAFEFSGNFARDMTYSIAWGLFALALLLIGFAMRTRATRYVGIGLLAATLLKLFLHDLANIGSGYRIGALMAVALIALAASFLYQRFLDRSGSADEP
jgi:uncharacterized membrane protein